MGDIRRNISRYEMRCRGNDCDGQGNNCGFDACDSELMDVLQETVDHFQIVVGDDGGVVTIEITGPNRCISHNEKVQTAYFLSKGLIYTPYSSKSMHRLAKAGDFKLWITWPTGYRTQISSKTVDVYLRARYSDKYGFGLYGNRNHVDVRKTKARWNG